jgi:serine/threonine-protein kinase
MIAGSGDLGAPQALVCALQGSPPAPARGLGSFGTAAQQTLLGGRYRLLNCLGSGGFGAVYEAEEVALGLRVAIKLLNRTALQDARMRQRFLQEARMIAELRSPHVVVLHDYAVTEYGVPYLVMELLSGKPLSHDMLSGPLSAQRAVHIMAQVCGALGDAHACGMVHRDIKPDNILLLTHAPPFAPGALLPTYPGAERDFVKVVDFGVARWCGVSTRASDILGTPAYISPETLADEPVDGRSDLYAVGMLLWQMIVGELPFPGKNQALMMKSHLDATRYRPREINPRYRLPDALEDLMVRLVARAPSDRPSSAYAVRAQMHELLSRPGLLPEKPLRGAARPDFGPHWDAPASATQPHAADPHAVTQAITVKIPTRIDAS